MKKIEVTTIDETTRPNRNSTKKHFMEIERIAQEEWDKDFQLTEMQFAGYQTLELAFKAAIKILEVGYKIDKKDLKRAFDNAFELYSMPRYYTGLVQRQGIQSISNATWADQKWYNLTKKDLFFALKPQIQDLLRKQGVNYDN